MELWKKLKPCTCGCKEIWVIHHESFLSHKCYVECMSCHKRTKTFIRTKKAITEWNNSNMESNKLTDWLKNDAEDCGIFAPPMKAQTAVDLLRRYLLGDDWYSVNPISTEQINTEVVHEILIKHSEKYRKELRMAKRGK